MINDFGKGHPAENHPRSLEKLRAAYFRDQRVANLLVATREDRVVAMVQWSLFYDQFWAMLGVQGEWLYVRPEARGLGIAAALVADVCERARRAGAEFLRAGSISDAVAQLYDRFAIGGPAYECHVSAEAFQVFADLAGKPVRDIVRGLPSRELGRPASSQVPALMPVSTISRWLAARAAPRRPSIARPVAPRPR